MEIGLPNRSVGEFAGMLYSTSGVLLSPAEYKTHAGQSLPSAGDKQFLAQLAKEKGMEGIIDQFLFGQARSATCETL